MDRVKKQLGCTENIQYSIATEEICVAVLDTGIGNHPDFEDRVVAFHDFVNGRQERYDDSGHGTHVAGCIGGVVSAELRPLAGSVWGRSSTRRERAA